MFPDTGKSYNDFPAYQEFFDNHLKPARILTETGREVTEYGRFVRVVGPVNGLICIHHRRSYGPVGICNPSLGKIHILPVSPSCSFTRYPKLIDRHVGLGFDDVAQDYKVVQLLSCRWHRGLHASMYSRATNSWRELSGESNILDQEVYIRGPIKSSSKNGSFCHWRGVRVVGGDDEFEYEHVIVSLDVNNEVFRVLEMPDYDTLQGFKYGKMKIFAKGDGSFVLFIFQKFDFNNGKGPKWLKIFGSRIEGNALRWDYVTIVGPFRLVIPKALWRRNCVLLMNFHKKVELIIYDYCAQEFVGRIEMTRNTVKIFEYRGSFVLP